MADELVEEYVHGNEQPKNIRRRVYDALNVLMAMGIIQKNRKQIEWVGLDNHWTPSTTESTLLELRVGLPLLILCSFELENSCRLI